MAIAPLPISSFSRNHSQIAVISPCPNLPPFHRSLYRAAFLMRVCTVRESAKRHDWSKFREETFDFFGSHIPQLELTKTWRVHYPSAKIQLDQFCCRGRVLAFLVHLADL